MNSELALGRLRMVEIRLFPERSTFGTGTNSNNKSYCHLQEAIPGSGPPAHWLSIGGFEQSRLNLPAARTNFALIIGAFPGSIPRNGRGNTHALKRV